MHEVAVDAHGWSSREQFAKANLVIYSFVHLISLDYRISIISNNKNGGVVINFSQFS